MEENFKKRITELLEERLKIESVFIEQTRQTEHNEDSKRVHNNILVELNKIRLILKELTNLNPVLANEVKKEFNEN
jgi:hypothetical protein